MPYAHVGQSKGFGDLSWLRTAMSPIPKGGAQDGDVAPASHGESDCKLRPRHLLNQHGWGKMVSYANRVNRTA